MVAGTGVADMTENDDLCDRGDWGWTGSGESSTTTAVVDSDEGLGGLGGDGDRPRMRLERLGATGMATGVSSRATGLCRVG